MRKRWITLGVLFALVGALGLFAWLKPAKIDEQALPIATPKTTKPDAARTLTVLRNGKPLATLEKRGTLWHLTEPLKAPADDFQVTRVLSVLEAKASASYASEPSSLAKFELSSPRAEIVIDGERYAFGGINNVTQEQYVLAGGRVHAVPLRHGAAVPNDAAALARRSLFAPGDKLVKFEFGDFTIAQDGIKWVITPAAELSQDMTNRWVAQWREGSALRAEAMDDRKPRRELIITLADGVRVTLGVIQTEPEFVVRRADLGLQFVYREEIGQQMLAAPPLQK